MQSKGAFLWDFNSELQYFALNVIFCETKQKKFFFLSVYYFMGNILHQKSLAQKKKSLSLKP